MTQSERGMGGRIICGPSAWTKDAVEAMARRGANALVARGAEGRRVALLFRNDVALIAASEAARFAGASPLQINWHLGAEEVGYILEDSGASILIAHADLWRRIASSLPPGLVEGLHVILAPTPPEIAAAYGIDTAATGVPAGVTAWDTICAETPPIERPVDAAVFPLLYTAGTTGRPKGVLRSTAGIPARVGYDAFFTPEVCTLVSAPVYHSAPNRFCFGTYAAGGSLVLPARFAAEETLSLIERHRVTTAFMVPTMFHRILRLPEDVRTTYDLSSLRHVVTAGAPCPPAMKEALIDWWGPVIYEYYGSTETSALTLCSSEEALARPGTVGRALPTAEIAIYDDAGRRCPPGVTGDVYGRRSDIPDFTYLNHPEARADIGRDGLVTVGDVGWLDEDGYLFLSDRKRDMIISGGTNIYPAQIEAALLEHPRVLDCAVFGIPDPEMGETVAAALQTDDGMPIDSDDLDRHLRARIATIMLPRRVIHHRALPRDANGKIRKRTLRAPFWDAAQRQT